MVVWARILLAVGGLAAVSAIIPVDRKNPPLDPSRELTTVLQAPTDIKHILDHSCADCHSHRTAWPWYTRFFPISSMTADDVVRGRKQMNLSAFVLPGQKPNSDHADELKEMCSILESEDMPPKAYVFLHSDAALTAAQKKTFCAWTETAAQKIYAEDAD
jgi:hypothetical protein